MGLKESQAEHWRGKSKEIIESYWTSSKAIERSKWFAQQLKKYKFNSIFEVGFFSGRNLHYIKEAFPSVSIAGLDINAKATRYAREKLGLDKDLYCMDLHSMGDIGETFDVVFTSGVAIHVPPDDVAGVLKLLIGLSNKYVMHIEQIGGNILEKGPKHLKPNYKVSDQIQWSPDLLSMYENLGYAPDVIPLPDECRTNGGTHLLIIKL